MRGLALDGRDIRRMTLNGGIYSSSGGVASATVSTPAYAGPSGAPVCRLDRVPGTTYSYALLRAVRPGSDTLPVGTRIRLAFWYRGVPPISGVRIDTDPATATIGASPSLPTCDPTSPDEWKRIVTGWLTTTGNAWLPTTAGSSGTYQSLRLACASTPDTAWIEWSDPVLIVGR